jgi:transcription antitermination factor NusA-like protein
MRWFALALCALGCSDPKASPPPTPSAALARAPADASHVAVATLAHDRQLERLFADAVPEIRAGIVKIDASVRSAGKRSKVAVSTSDPNVDPVERCVGDKGSRIRKVVEALQGEYTDIVPYDPDPARFVSGSSTTLPIG